MDIWIALVLITIYFSFCLMSMGPIRSVMMRRQGGRGDQDINFFLQVLAWPYFLPRAFAWAAWRRKRKNEMRRTP